MKTRQTWLLAGAGLGAGLLCLGIAVWQKNHPRRQNQESLEAATHLPDLRGGKPAGLAVLPGELGGGQGSSGIQRQPNETARPTLANAPPGRSPVPETAVLASGAATNAADGAFEAKLTTSIPAGQTLAFGGWTTESGKRAVAFLHPAIEAGNGTNAQVVIRATFMEVPPEVWSGLGLTDIKADPQLGSQTGLMSQSQAESLVASLADKSDCLILNRPAIQTTDGVRATLFVGQVTASNQLKGQLLDCLPQVDADGQTINLSLLLKFGPQTRQGD